MEYDAVDETRSWVSAVFTTKGRINGKRDRESPRTLYIKRKMISNAELTNYG